MSYYYEAILYRMIYSCDGCFKDAHVGARIVICEYDKGQVNRYFNDTPEDCQKCGHIGPVTQVRLYGSPEIVFITDDDQETKDNGLARLMSIVEHDTHQFYVNGIEGLDL